MEEVQEGAVGEGRQGEGKQENRDADDAQDETAPAQRGFKWNVWVAHGGDQQEESPENPSYPEKRAKNDERNRQADGKDAVEAGRDGVEDVAAVQLPSGDEIQRGDEEANPAGYQHRVGRGVAEGRNQGIPVRQQCMQQTDG